MLLLCCNLLSLAEGGSTTVWWLGVSICLIAVRVGHAKAGHAADNWIGAIGSKEHPEEVRVKRSQKPIEMWILYPWVSGTRSFTLKLIYPHQPLQTLLRCTTLRAALLVFSFFYPTRHSLGPPPAPPLLRRRPHNKTHFPLRRLS